VLNIFDAALVKKPLDLMTIGSSLCGIDLNIHQPPPSYPDYIIPQDAKRRESFKEKKPSLRDCVSTLLPFPSDNV
jgi:hypothetical protein